MATTTNNETTTTEKAYKGLTEDNDDWPSRVEDIFDEASTDTAMVILMLFGLVVLVGGLIYCVSRILCLDFCADRVFCCCHCLSNEERVNNNNRFTTSFIKRIVQGKTKEAKERTPSAAWASKRPQTATSFHEDVFEKDQILYHIDMEKQPRKNHHRRRDDYDNNRRSRNHQRW